MRRILQSMLDLVSTARDERVQQKSGRKVQENEWGRMKKE